MNTEFRKNAKSDFEKNFYKLMNNSVFGITMENLRNRVDIKIVKSNETDKIRKLVASPLYSRHVIFSNDLVGISDMRKSKLLLNKPVFTGMTILDNSKILMYDFFYNELKKKYGTRFELLYTDTDSLLLEIETEDFYGVMKSNENLYDTSDFPKEHPLYSDANKKVLGKMKDECNGTPIAECVCLRPKMYSILKGDEKNIKKETQAPTLPLFNKLKWLPFYTDTLISKCAILFKRIQLSVPDYLIEALNFNSSLHSRNNRFSKLNFLTPRYRLKTEGGSTFLVTAIEQWNMLGADLKKEVTVKSFRRALHQKVLINQQFLPHF